MDKISIAFKKLLGKGRAWICADGFTSELLDVLISPLVELKERFMSLQFSHFPTTFFDENNILNGEELFAITDINNLTLEERAARVEMQWSLVGGQGLGYVQSVINAANLPIRVSENIPTQDLSIDVAIQYGNVQYGEDIGGYPAQYGMNSYRVIGNGLLNNAGIKQDPVNFNNYKNSFFLKGLRPITSRQWDTLTSLILAVKPLQTVAVAEVIIQ